MFADDEFERWKAQEQTAFSQFQTSEDRAFIAFLETEWQAFERFKGVSRDQTPKPAAEPRISNSLAATPDRQPTQVALRTPLEMNGTFFAHRIQSVTLPDIKWPDLSRVNGETLAAVWSTLSSVDHGPVLSSLASMVNDLALGDWGALQLCRHVLQQENSRQQAAHCWFLLNRLGYDLRIAYDEQNIFLLMPATIAVYGHSFIRLDDRPFYILAEGFTGDGSDGTPKLRAYERSSNRNLRDFDLTLRKVMMASGATRSYIVHDRTGNRRAPLELDYDAGRSALLATHPQIDLEWYFSAPPGAPTAASLGTALKPLITSLPERDAINQLLHFVQDSFSYQTDQTQFGKERYLLAEESLNYGINDCEDRAILLAWLLHDLLSLDIIVLDYPGHVALAVRTALLETDEFVVHDGRKYVVLDPTYIGADAGMVMPAVAAFSPVTFAADYLEPHH